ncbi:MAG: primosomal protein N' [Firmicutes bacterium]|nr:primosomal protein N' [Bacillota bacterium]
MTNYVKIIVDIPLSHLDNSYDYRVPEKYKDIIKIGHAVKVRFGNRMVVGFVIGFSNTTDLDKDRVRDISSIITKEELFNEEMLELFKWMASYYKCLLVKVIKSAIPTGVITGKVKKKRVRFLSLNQNQEETDRIINELRKKAPKQKEILEFLLANDEYLTTSQLAERVNTSAGTVSRLIKKGYLKYEEKISRRRPYFKKSSPGISKPDLTKEQQEVIDEILVNIKGNKTDSYLLHGVTGSGKTEVYLRIIEEGLSRGKGAIVLVPEISLTPMMVRRFYQRFDDKIAVLHSNLSLGERYDEWRRLYYGEALIAIGARSAVFAPVKNCGLIIIDEEHETSYKQGENPYYHAREVALKRVKLSGGAVILGSATPSLESYYYAQEGKFKYLALTERINTEEMPPVSIIDMREELKNGNTSIFSTSLKKAINHSLLKKEQVLIFLNRRGYANFILCRECGHVIKCKNCDISLTYHESENSLRCHYCDFTSIVPRNCPACGSVFIKKFGIGTERIEEELKKEFTGAVIERMDVDTTTRKGSHYEILERIEKGETDILVGTQMIAKGHDYPNISVVGVITADNILNLPDFRSAERTFQLLTQVAGRTGRGSKNGEVIIQTYTPEHYSIIAASKHDYLQFYNQEINSRKKLFYPPFSQLVNIIIQGYQEEGVVKAAEQLNIFLKDYHQFIKEILGPSPAPINKLRNRYRWQVILKIQGWAKRNFILAETRSKFLPEQDKEIGFIIDVDPIKML